MKLDRSQLVQTVGQNLSNQIHSATDWRADAEECHFRMNLANQWLEILVRLTSHPADEAFVEWLKQQRNTAAVELRDMIQRGRLNAK